MNDLLKLVETTVTPTAVRMRFADTADVSKARYWLDFQVPLTQLKLPAGVGDIPLGNPEALSFADVKQGALRYVREQVGGETHRLAHVVARGGFG